MRKRGRERRKMKEVEREKEVERGERSGEKRKNIVSKGVKVC